MDGAIPLATAVLLHASEREGSEQVRLHLEQALETRNVIEQAKGVLAARHHIRRATDAAGHTDPRGVSSSSGHRALLGVFGHVVPMELASRFFRVVRW
jgi:hypothetical protein